MEKRTALVTAIGSFSADCVIRNLKENGFRVIGTDIYDKNWVACALDVDVFYKAPMASDEDAYIAFLKEIIEKEHVCRILPLIDVEVDALNRHRREIENADCVICMSGQETIEILRDKVEVSQQVGGVLNTADDPDLRGAIRVIPTRRASEIDFEQVTYPIVLKPVNGRSSNGLYRIYQEDQLGFAFANILNPEKIDDDALERYIVQPLIKGNVITVDVVRDRKGNCTAVAREELLRTPNGAGLSVKVFRDELLEKACRRIAERTGVLGCVNFEFIRGEGSGVYYFIECNPRFSGGIAFTELAGVRMVRAHLAVFDGAGLSGLAEPQTGYMTRKYQEIRM